MVYMLTVASLSGIVFALLAGGLAQYATARND
jgi:hypothetical protein